MTNTPLRLALSVLSVPLLAAPSAYGVYLYLAPESGWWAMSAAVGFEALYIGVNVLALRNAELRQYAERVALAAVITAVVFNTLAHYALKVPGAYSGAALSPLAALLSLITSLPLAGLAYAVSVLLHRLSEDTVTHTAPLSEEVTILAVDSVPDVKALSDSGVLLSKSERVKRVALSQGWSESKAWREVKKHPALLEGVER